MQVNIPTGRVVASCFTTGDFDMPHHGAASQRQSPTAARRSTTHISITRRRCLSAPPDRSRPSARSTPARRTSCARWRTGSSTTGHVRRTSSTMHSCRFSEMPKTSILHADPPGAGSTRSSATPRSKMHENARRELALEDDTLNAICEREQTVPTPRPASRTA